jgi:hypothetical protein
VKVTFGYVENFVLLAYGAKELLLFIEGLGKFYYVPLKCNRQIDDSGGVLKYRCVDALV